MAALRSLLLDGRFPPNFWSVLLRIVVWVLNRIVGRNGYAPCEKFDMLELSFDSLKTIPCVLVYWHINKRNCTYSKISLTGGTATYIGPGEAFGESGQKVYTSDDRLIATPYVVADETILPLNTGCASCWHVRPPAPWITFRKVSILAAMYCPMVSMRGHYSELVSQKSFGQMMNKSLLGR
jgi:hypothetical protein